jgi:hypothetical protein
MVNATAIAERNYKKLEANSRALEMISERRTILEQIMGSNGRVSNPKAKEIAASFASPLGYKTVINFAMGETKNPDRYTWTYLGRYAKGMEKTRTWLIEGSFTPPEGVKAIEVK